MWRNKKFLHNCQDFTILHIFHVEKSEILLKFSDFSPFSMYRNLKILHLTDFSPHVNFVTNMRYVQYAIMSPIFFLWMKTNHLRLIRILDNEWINCQILFKVFKTTDLVLVHAYNIFIMNSQFIGSGLYQYQLSYHTKKKVGGEVVSNSIFSFPFDNVCNTMYIAFSKELRCHLIISEWIKNEYGNRGILRQFFKENEFMCPLSGLSLKANPMKNYKQVFGL